MIAIPGGWAQWDYQIGTFRAEVDGVVHGAFTGDIGTVEALAAVLLSAHGIELTADELEALRQSQEGHG